MKRTIALAGNPNCGKTSLFNELTGANQYVGNWPGVTVEKVTGKLIGHEETELLDLPGIYSLSPYTPEEVVSRRYLLEEKPDLVLNIVDATNLERNLYLTTQLIETGIPIVIALNMIDLAEGKEKRIDADALSRAIGCPVFKVSALLQKGLPELVEELTKETLSAPAKPICYAPPVEDAIAAICRQFPCSRLESVKMLENDSDFIAHLDKTARHEVESLRLTVEREMDDDIASLIAAARYDAICNIIPEVTRGSETEPANLSDRIDAVLTHRVAGLAIFVAVMWFVYFISITTIGTWGTDWANDVLFGEYVSGWMDGLLGDTPASFADMLQIGTVLTMILAFPVTLRRLHDIGLNGSWLYLAIAPYLLEYMCPHLPDFLHTGLLCVLYAANAFLLLACLSFPGSRFPNKYGNPHRRIARNPMKINGRANRQEYILHFLLMSIVSFGITYLGGHACLQCSPQVCSLINDGIVSGVGAVLGFLPQMAVLFLLLALLEDCGYMARVAFMMDRIFRTIGLSGKSFIPLMVAMGCGVPAIMSTRTIENEKDRRMSVMLTTFVPCGAKLPIIALFAALLGQDSLVATAAYFAGIGSVILGGIMLRKTHMFAGSYTPFVMELPPYHTPRGANINMRAMERCKAFVYKAGTIIFISCALIWFTGNYNWRMQYLGEQDGHMEKSMLADIGNSFAPLFTPLGWGDWRPAVATVTGLVAKEEIVGTIGVLYPDTEEDSEEGNAAAETSEGNVAVLPKFNAFSALSTAAWCAVAPDKVQLNEENSPDEEEDDDSAETSGIAARLQAADTFRTTGAAFSFMLFNLLCAPCFAACGAIRREMNSPRWTFLAIGYMCAWAYAVSLITYQLDLLINHGIFHAWSVVAIGLCAGILCQVFRPTPQRKSF